LLKIKKTNKRRTKPFCASAQYKTRIFDFVQVHKKNFLPCNYLKYLNI